MKTGNHVDLTPTGTAIRRVGVLGGVEGWGDRDRVRSSMPILPFFLRTPARGGAAKPWEPPWQSNPGYTTTPRHGTVATANQHVFASSQSSKLVAEASSQCLANNIYILFIGCLSSSHVINEQTSYYAIPMLERENGRLGLGWGNIRGPSVNITCLRPGRYCLLNSLDPPVVAGVVVVYSGGVMGCGYTMFSRHRFSRDRVRAL